MSEQSVSVQDLMTSDVITLGPEDDLGSAQLVMRLKKIRHLPVVRDRQLVGLITHRDLLHAMISSAAQLNPAAQAIYQGRILVKDRMSRDLITVGPEDSATDAGRKLYEGQFGCLPVVDGQGHLVGIVTESDFVHFALRLLEAMQQ